MNNKPVAWIREDGVVAFHEKTEVDSQGFKWFPLYTHPVKELTDEEIRHIQAQCHLKDVGYDGFIMRFARAILRKAQEVKAKYGITTKWNGITTYHETTEPIGKAQENERK